MNAGPDVSRAQSGGDGTVAKKRPRRVLIVDDHPIVRQGLRRLIDQRRDFDVCGEAEIVWGGIVSE
jgi:hypothetical protein